MSALADHPNTLEARELRRHEIEHAMRCLYRDHTWIDPDGDLEVISWLRRIHYLRPGTETAWLRAARIFPLTPVGQLGRPAVERLIWQMLRFLGSETLQTVGDPPLSVADSARGSRQIDSRSAAASVPPGAAAPSSPQRAIAPHSSTFSHPEALTVGSCACAASTVRADGGTS